MTTLETHDLCVSIGSKAICQNLSLSIKPGEVWGILGRNGIGKTTLLHTLAGLRQPQQGQITLDGIELAQISRKQLAKKLSVLLQQLEDSFPASVLELVLSGRHPHIDNWSWEAPQDYQIARSALSLVDLLSRQYDSIEQLSGGEKQRVSIARLLTQSPDIYLLDEPNSHLDLKYQIQLLKHFVSLTQNNSKSIITSLHDINLVQQYCSHVLLLFGDNEVKQGTTAELLNEETLSQLYQHPMKCFETDNQAFFFAENK